jgi:hypothetical protein
VCFFLLISLSFAKEFVAAFISAKKKKQKKERKKILLRVYQRKNFCAFERKLKRLEVFTKLFKENLLWQSSQQRKKIC